MQIKEIYNIEKYTEINRRWHGDALFAIIREQLARGRLCAKKAHVLNREHAAMLYER